jgi:hypothetical protein
VALEAVGVIRVCVVVSAGLHDCRRALLRRLFLVLRRIELVTVETTERLALLGLRDLKFAELSERVIGLMRAVRKEVVELLSALWIRKLKECSAGFDGIGREADVAIGTDGRRVADKRAAIEIFALLGVTLDTSRMIGIGFNFGPLEGHRRLRVRDMTRDAVVRMFLALVFEVRPIDDLRVRRRRARSWPPRGARLLWDEGGGARRHHARAETRKQRAGGDERQREQA